MHSHMSKGPTITVQSVMEARLQVLERYLLKEDWVRVWVGWMSKWRSLIGSGMNILMG